MRISDWSSDVCSSDLPVPGREHFLLERPLDRTLGSEVWLARQPRSRQARVFKFSLDGERLSAIKREATLMRVLRDTLGERDDFARVIDWNRSEEHTSELQSLMRISYAVFCLKKKKKHTKD